MNEIELAAYVDGIERAWRSGAPEDVVFLDFAEHVTKREVELVNIELKRRGVDAELALIPEWKGLSL